MIEDAISRQRALAFDHLYDAVVVTDLKGTIIDWNTGSETLYGYTKEEVLGQAVGILHVPDDLDHVTRDVLDSIAREGKWTGEIRMVKKDGTIGWIESMCVPLLDDDDSTIGALGINRDITKRIEREQQMVVQSRLAQMGEMISMIAHQWRQPLSAISALTSNATVKLLSDRLDFEDLQKREISRSFLLDTFKRVEELTVHLSDTINGFREFFKPHKEVATFDIRSVIDRALELLAGSLSAKEITLLKEYSDLPNIVNYEFEVVQVLLNIIKNAVDVFDEFEVKDATIKVACTSSVLGQKITLFNNGPQIEKEHMSKIFEPYFSTKEKNGTGLGLYMSKVIIEEHCKGLLTVENSEKGVCFTIDLPISLK